jgi:endonuclease YncB( thermonuclease family)
LVSVGPEPVRPHRRASSEEIPALLLDDCAEADVLGQGGAVGVDADMKHALLDAHRHQRLDRERRPSVAKSPRSPMAIPGGALTARVRLAGVNAREIDGTCNNRTPCRTASADDAAAALDRLALGQVLSCIANGRSYNRIAAFCRRSYGVDLSCAMLESNTVARWDRHWRGHRC